MSRTSSLLDHVCEDVLRASHAYPSAERRWADAEDPLRGQSFEPSSATPRLYCMVHEGDLGDCPEHDLCTGVPIDAPNDPVGELAVVTAEHEPPTRRRRARAEELIERMARDADELTRILAADTSRGPTAKERRETDAANEVGCEVCARSEKHVRALVRDATCNGALARPHALCRWHNDFVLLHGELPTPVEEARHHAGKRVVRAVREVDRLRQGLATGTYSSEARRNA